MNSDKDLIKTALNKELAQLQQICDRLSDRDRANESISVESIDNAVEQEAVMRSVSAVKDMDLNSHLLHNMEQS